MEILTAEQIKETDAFAIQSGLKETDLIENAGFAAACRIVENFDKAPVCVLCGTGNNGADGFACARILKEFGWNVTVLLYGSYKKMRPAALEKYAAFEGDVYPFDLQRVQKDVQKESLFVDALFGTGFSKNLPDEIQEAFEFLNKSETACIALDIPSGVNADTGTLCPVCLKCTLTITFCRFKPAAFLYPAKEFFGKTVLHDAGIPNQAVQNSAPFIETIDETTVRPAAPSWTDHKYTRGAVLIVGGEMTGAARLAALSALNAGAGLVKIVCPKNTFSIYGQNPAFVTQTCDDETSLSNAMNDKKIKSIAVGMGLGNGSFSQKAVDCALKSGKPCVFDADALTFLKGKNLNGNAVLTPHAGEFATLCPDIRETSKVNRALTAAKRFNAVFILKGADSVVASPEKAAVNTNAPFSLATAGSGDVLAGITAACLANGLSPYDAAKAAVCIHSNAAAKVIGNISALTLIENIS